MGISRKSILPSNFGLIVAGMAGFAILGTLLLHSQPVDGMSAGVWAWWAALCAVSVLNIWGWRLSAAALVRRKALAQPEVYLFQRRQLLLSAVYVLGCAFRSFLPRADVQRIGLFDSWVSSVIVGRSVATVAELCFVAQWALLLHRIATEANARYSVLLSRLLVPLIVVAELCSWHAVLTTSFLGNAIEESIWALCAGLVIVSLLALWPSSRPSHRPFLAAALVLGVAYVTFMVTVDVPMYVSRWLADEANGREYLSLGQGLWDVGARWTVTFDWEAWRTEIPWMTLYFSVGVWCSIALVHTPRFEPGRIAIIATQSCDCSGARSPGR
jgi:hypothetical protein